MCAEVPDHCKIPDPLKVFTPSLSGQCSKVNKGMFRLGLGSFGE